MTLCNYRIIPMTIAGFKREFNVKDTLSIVDEYYQYLHQNKDLHHYNGFTIDEWYELQLRAFYGT